MQGLFRCIGGLSACAPSTPDARERDPPAGKPPGFDDDLADQTLDSISTYLQTNHRVRALAATQLFWSAPSA